MLIIDRDEHTWNERAFERIILLKSFVPLTGNLSIMDPMLTRFPLKIDPTYKIKFLSGLSPKVERGEEKDREHIYVSSVNNKLWLMKDYA